MMSLARDLSLELRPKMLDDLGLLPALLYLFESFTSRTHVAVQFEHQDCIKKYRRDRPRAYRIVKEALENVAAHAGTGEAGVRVWSDRWILAVRIEDKGTGLRQTDFPGLGGGYQRHAGRALIMGGRFSITSTPGKGTVVAAELPLPVRSRR
jgi:signal transduction histidine kinase